MAENERLKEFRNSLSLSQSELAKYLGIKQAAYSFLESGRNTITDKTISTIKQVINKQ